MVCVRRDRAGQAVGCATGQDCHRAA